MLLTRLVAWMLSVGLMGLGSGVVYGQDFPNKPIRVVTGRSEGLNDLLARLIAQGISDGLKQNVIVENRPSNVIGEVVVKALPDGYTLLSAGGAFLIGPLLRKTPYDPVRDFSPITMTSRAPLLLVVHPSVPAKSVKELIALAKARPGELNYAAGQRGGGPHLAGELFKSMAGVNIVSIPYKGGGPAVIAMLGGEVELMFNTIPSVTPHIKAGKLNVFGVTSAEPSPLAPGVPTIAASGVPGYESETIQGMWVPAKTPAAIINRLNREIVQFLSKPDVKERFLSLGIEAAPSSPAQFASAMKSEITKWGKVIKDAGIRNE